MEGVYATGSVGNKNALLFIFQDFRESVFIHPVLRFKTPSGVPKY